MESPEISQRVIILDCIAKPLIGASADVVEVDGREIAVMPIEHDRRVRYFDINDLPYFEGKDG